MGDFDPAFIATLATQSWALYSVGMFLIILRTFARIHRYGIRGLMVDDYLMILAGCLYTILIACLNVISGGGGSNLYAPEDFPTFTPEEIQDRIHGSKIVIVSEQAMLNVIYTVKACMLIMYTRLTLGLTAQKLVFYLKIYVAVGWLATEVAFFTACRPFDGYWAMPPPDPQCTTLQYYAIVQGCFNITSDTLMLCIPLPLLARLSMPWKQKAILLLIFSMGIFVILAAILTKVFNLTNVWDPSYMLWYTREASVAVYVSNLPMIWPLLREYFPVLRGLTPGQRGYTASHHGAGGSQAANLTAESRRANAAAQRLSHAAKGSIVTTTIRGTALKGDSTEELSSGSDTEMKAISSPRHEAWAHSDNAPTTGVAIAPGSAGLGGWDMGKGVIHKVTTVHVSEEHVDCGGGRGVESGAESDGELSRRDYALDVEKATPWGL